jgi:hypothetical protein
MQRALVAVEFVVNTHPQNAGLAYPEFAINPDTKAPQILPIDYIEPQVGNEIAFGLDSLSEPSYRSTANLARDTNLPAATASIALDQEVGGQMEFLPMLPIYDPSIESATVEKLRESFAGVVCAGFRMDDLVSGKFGVFTAAVESELVPDPILISGRSSLNVRHPGWWGGHTQQQPLNICAGRVTMQEPDLTMLRALVN